MSTTPRTDAVQFLDQSDYHDPSAVDWFVRADFARELETELNAALAELGKMFLSAAETADRNVELRRRAEKAEAELATEREKVRVLREALELIANQADACKAFCDTFTPASRIKARAALEATEEASK